MLLTKCMCENVWEWKLFQFPFGRFLKFSKKYTFSFAISFFYYYLNFLHTYIEPEPPREIAIRNLNSLVDPKKSVNISWIPPRVTNGIITKYKVVVKPALGSDRQLGTTTPFIVLSNDLGNIITIAIIAVIKLYFILFSIPIFRLLESWAVDSFKFQWRIYSSRKFDLLWSWSAVIHDSWCNTLPSILITKFRTSIATY